MRFKLLNTQGQRGHQHDRTSSSTLNLDQPILALGPMVRCIASWPFIGVALRSLFTMYAQVISETFCERDMPPSKVAEMFAEADWDGSGRVRNP